MAYNVFDVMTTQEKADCLTASGTPGTTLWTNALAALDAAGTTEIRWPKGIFTFTAPITIGRQISLYGEYLYTSFEFPADTAGITIDGFGTLIDGMDFYADTSAGSTLTAHGVDVKERCRIRNTSSRFFGGNGFNIVCQTPTNGNQWRLENCSASGNNKHGLYTQGDNANAGVAEQFDAVSNGGCGIYENSLLGNLYSGCHASANGWKLGRCSHGGNLYWAGLSIAATPTIEPLATMTDIYNDPWYYKEPGAPSATWPAWNVANTYQYCPNYYSNSGEDVDRVLTGVPSWTTWLQCYSETGAMPNYMARRHPVIGGDLGGGVFNAFWNLGDKIPRTTLGASIPTFVGRTGDQHINDAPTLGENYGWICLSDDAVDWHPFGVVGTMNPAALFESGPDSYGNQQ
jgi:hypothetical protein